MPTQYPDLFRALAEPFAQAEIKTRVGAGGKALSYVTAATVMNRLDEVLGPENWRPTYHADPTGNPLGVVCRLTIRLPNGEEVTKEDIGGISEMKDPSDGPKSGYTDALKRAASAFGVGRHLRRDGVPDYTTPGDEIVTVEVGDSPPSDGGNSHRYAKYAEFLEGEHKRLGMKDAYALHRAVVQALTESNFTFTSTPAERRNEVAQLYECNDAGWNDWFKGFVDDLRASQK